MTHIFNNYDLVARRTFELVDWKDKVEVKGTVRNAFDYIHVSWTAFRTDTTGLNTVAIRILNLDCNIEVVQEPSGSQIAEGALAWFLDPRNDALVFYENPLPPIKLPRVMGNYIDLDYEIYINTAQAYAGISISNPLFVCITFLKSR